MDESYDLVVIGGGAAGLSGAIAVARLRRSVLVLDAGHPRNAPAEGVHNLLGHDGVPPLELVARGREELRSYGGHVEQAEVVAARPVDGTEVAFDVDLADGRSVRGRSVLVATGARDVLPAIDGLAERWGRDVLHCPFCHGWEARGERIGILAVNALAVHAAKLWSQVAGEVTVLEHESGALSAEDRATLATLDVKVIEGPVAQVLVRDDKIRGVRVPAGEIALDALVVASVVDARTPLLEGLGVTTVPVDMGGAVVGWVAQADPVGLTDVPGVAVAGNLTDISAQVAQSMAAGTKAGGMLVMGMIERELTELTEVPA